MVDAMYSPVAVAFSFGGNQLLIVETQPTGVGPSAIPSPKRAHLIPNG